MAALWDRPTSKHVRKVLLHDHWWGMGHPQTRNIDLAIDLVERSSTGTMTVHLDFAQTDTVENAEFQFRTDGAIISNLIYKFLAVPLDETPLPLGRGSRHTDRYASRWIELSFGGPDGTDGQTMKLVADPWEPDLAPWKVSIDGVDLGYANSGVVRTSWDAIWAKAPRHKLRDLEERRLTAEQRLERAYDRTSFFVRFRDGEARVRPGESPGPLMDAGIRSRSATSMAIITACNPRSILKSEIENEQSQRRLAVELKRRGFPWYLEARGEPSDLDTDWRAEPSFAIFDIPLAEAIEVGRAFDQKAIVFLALGDAVRVIDCQTGADLSESYRLNSPSAGSSKGKQTECIPLPTDAHASAGDVKQAEDIPQPNVAQYLEKVKSLLRDTFHVKSLHAVSSGFWFANFSSKTHIFCAAPDEPTEDERNIEAIIQVVTLLPKDLGNMVEGKSGVLNRMATLGALTLTTEGWAVVSRVTAFEGESAWRLFAPLVAASAFLGVSTLFGAASKALAAEANASQARSEWIESDFDELVNKYTSRWPCSGGGLGMSLEFPLSGDSRSALEGNPRTALLRLSADQPHPVLGGGLLCRLEMPHRIHDTRRLDQVIRALNELEGGAGALPPHAGAWCEGSMETNLCYVMFVPNGFRRLQIHQNVIAWFAWRAQFANAALHARGIPVA